MPTYLKKTHVRTSESFLRLLTAAVAQTYSNDYAIRYVGTLVMFSHNRVGLATVWLVGVRVYIIGNVDMGALLQRMSTGA